MRCTHPPAAVRKSRPISPFPVGSPTKALSSEEQDQVAERLLATSTHSSRQRVEARTTLQQQQSNKAKKEKKKPLYVGIAASGVPYQIDHHPVTCARPRPAEPSRPTKVSPPPPPFTSPPLLTLLAPPQQETRSSRWADGESPLVAPRRKKTAVATSDIGLEVSPSRREAATQGDPIPLSPTPRHLNPVQLAALSLTLTPSIFEATRLPCRCAGCHREGQSLNGAVRFGQQQSLKQEQQYYHLHTMDHPAPRLDCSAATAHGCPSHEQHYDAPLRTRGDYATSAFIGRGRPSPSMEYAGGTHTFATLSDATRSPSRVSSLTNQD